MEGSHSFTYVDGDTQVELAEARFTSEEPSRRLELSFKSYKFNH
jgi:hypothetical protein